MDKQKEILRKNTEKRFKAFRELKAKHKDALIILRCGDFYETYAEDAEEMAKTLKISVLKRGGVPFAGFPHYSLDIYLPKLVRAGYRVAICDDVPSKS